jgi:hypothetical protein
MDAYDSISIDQLNPSHAETLRELFPDPQGKRREVQGKATRLIANDG